MFFEQDKVDSHSYGWRIDFLLGLLEGHLNTLANRGFVIDCKAPIALFNLFNNLSSLSPSLLDQKNLDLLKGHPDSIADINEVFSLVPIALRTQDNFEALFNCPHHLKTLNSKIIATLPHSGGSSPGLPLTQKAFDDIINEGLRPAETVILR